VNRSGVVRSDSITAASAFRPPLLRIKFVEAMGQRPCGRVVLQIQFL